MEPRPFADPSTPPTAEALERVLGDAHGSYRTLTKVTAGLAREWVHTGTGGWMEKVHAHRKALCYFVPLGGVLRVSLTVRPRERAPLLADEALASVHAAFTGARKYPEGYALRFDVTDRASCAPVATLLARLIALRG